MDRKDLTFLALVMYLRKKRRRVQRSKWSKNWLMKRSIFSHINLIKELQMSEPHDYRNYLRMDENTYTHLLELVTALIQKKDTIMRKSITPHERLVATLRFLATGRSYEDLKYSCAISKQSLSVIIPETCWAIYRVLNDEYLKFPTTEAEWIAIAEDFETLWQFPHCLGAVDGKHIQIVPPPESGSYYYNYKGTHSIVLMAIVNANYEFILCDVGTNGRVSDGGVIENTTFYRKLKANSLNLPCPQNNGTRKDQLNYVFISDEAFTLRTDFLKPFSQRQLDVSRRIYNYRLSRARRIVENAFGILANRFQVFSKPINLKLASINLVVMACCVLHNYLRRKCQSTYTPPEALDFEDIEAGQVNIGYRTRDDCGMIDLSNNRNRNHRKDAKEVRDDFKNYFNAEGAVPWQYRMIGVQTPAEYNDDNTEPNEERLAEEAVDDVEPVGSNESEVEGSDNDDDDVDIEDIFFRL